MINKLSRGLFALPIVLCMTFLSADLSNAVGSTTSANESKAGKPKSSSSKLHPTRAMTKIIDTIKGLVREDYANFTKNVKTENDKNSYLFVIQLFPGTPKLSEYISKLFGLEGFIKQIQGMQTALEASMKAAKDKHPNNDKEALKTFQTDPLYQEFSVAIQEYQDALTSAQRVKESAKEYVKALLLQELRVEDMPNVRIKSFGNDSSYEDTLEMNPDLDLSGLITRLCLECIKQQHMLDEQVRSNSTPSKASKNPPKSDDQNKKHSQKPGHKEKHDGKHHENDGQKHGHKEKHDGKHHENDGHKRKKGFFG